MMFVGAQSYCLAQEFSDSIPYELKEVVIEAENHSVSNNVSKYIPNSKQKNAAQSGIMLLGLMAIPQLDVDMASLSVKTMAGQSVKSLSITMRLNNRIWMD